MTPATLKAIAFRCLAVSLLLLMVEQAAFMTENPFTEAFVNLSILTGLLGGGLYVAAAVKPADRLRDPVLSVWAVGLVVCAVGILLRLIPYGTALHLFADRLNAYVGFPLAAIALGYWLIGRFSTTWTVWQRESLYTVAGLMALAGTLLTLSPVAPFVGNLTLFAAPILVLIVMAHSYHALANRNDNATLAPHWYALGLLLWLLGMGLLGGLRAQPDIYVFTMNLRITQAQSLLTLFAPLCIILGVINQIGAELHGQNGRITGYAPFWLVAFGVIGAALALAADGLVQAYLLALTPMTPSDIGAQLRVLDALGLLGKLSAACGVGIYALSFWLRRPPIPKEKL